MALGTLKVEGTWPILLCLNFRSLLATSGDSTYHPKQLKGAGVGVGCPGGIREVPFPMRIGHLKPLQSYYVNPLLLPRWGNILTRSPTASLKFYTKSVYALFCEEGHRLHQILDRPLTLLIP